jgi:hypothetical protein
MLVSQTRREDRDGVFTVEKLIERERKGGMEEGKERNGGCEIARKRRKRELAGREEVEQQHEWDGGVKGDNSGRKEEKKKGRKEEKKKGRKEERKGGRKEGRKKGRKEGRRNSPSRAPLRSSASSPKCT